MLIVICRHKLMVSWLQSNSERRHNLIVVVPSTPAQYFHCLRRQIHRPFAKPLVVMSAKWLLHHKACASRLDDLAEGSFFHRVIVENGKGDNTTVRRTTGGSGNKSQSSHTHTNTAAENSLVEPEKIRKVIFCCGSVFYHLFHARAASKINDITFVRIEQIAPFPFDLVGPIIQKYPNADLVWVQEEPKNMGAWSYAKPRFDTTCREEKIQKSIRYVGRHPCASPATGGFKQHFTEQKSLIAEALL